MTAAFDRDDDVTTRAGRIAAINGFALRIHEILDVLVVVSKTIDNPGLALATMHLQDSCAAFAAACRRTIESEDDDDD